MTEPVVALPMYDWPEAVAETDAEWRRLRAALAAFDVAAPERLARSNADLPPVPGGAALAPDGFDFQALWRHPALLFAQTCWGPLEEGLAAAVQLVGQPSYDAFEGGEGPLYASAVVMRGKGHAEPRADGQASLPLDLMRGKRFAYNSLDSMSGILAPSRDLGGLDLFAERRRDRRPSRFDRRGGARAGRTSPPSIAAAGTWRAASSRRRPSSPSSAGRRGGRGCPTSPGSRPPPGPWRACARPWRRPERRSQRAERRGSSG